MRYSPQDLTPPKFPFWTRAECVRLSLILVACACPMAMPTRTAPSVAGSDNSAPTPKVGRALSSGQMRTVRVTEFDVTKLSSMRLGDTLD